MKWLIVPLMITCFSLTSVADIPSSFSKSKEIAEEEIYEDHRISFYCGCSYTENKEVNQVSCGYKPRKPLTRSGKENKRDNRIEWEHVLPASIMGENLSCWGDQRGELFPACVKSNGKLHNGRTCCQKVNPTFKNAHNDLVNLTPAIGEVNGNRSNHRYGIIEGETRKYGACDFEFEDNIAEPSERVRGDIARIQLYMLETYGEALNFSFTEERVEMLIDWAGQDPVSDWELTRNERICQQQDQSNFIISECN